MFTEITLSSGSKRLGLVLVAVLFTSVSAADSEAGKALAKSKGCVDCHGLSGNTGYESDDNRPVPKIAGQPKQYLVKTLKEYRSGARHDKTMNLLMKSRTDQEIETLAEYYASQKRY